MKTLLTLLCVLYVSALGQTFNVTTANVGSINGAGGAPAVSYLIQQDFEGTGYDNSETWTPEGTGTADPDSVSPALVGSQSLKLTESATYINVTSPTFASKSEVWSYFQMQVGTVANGRRFLNFYSDSTLIARVRMNAFSGIDVVSGTGEASTGVTFSTGVTYHVWFHWKSGDTVDVGFSTDGTRPTLSPYFASISSGVASGTINKVMIGQPASEGTDTSVYSLDKVRVDDVLIDSNPE